MRDASNAIRINESSDGAAVHLQLSQTLLVALTEHTTAGEIWELQQSDARKWLSGGDWYERLPDGAVGAENVHVFSWTAREAGLAELRYRLTRVSDETVASFACHVHITST